MYYEDIKMKNGDGCEQEALIILILHILMGDIKEAESSMFELSNL